MNKLRHLLSYLFLFAVTLSAQTPGNIWYFGGRCGLDFSSGSPVVLNNSQMTAAEGCITVSNSSGLLFYSNGDSIWDRNHNWMTNSVGPGFGGYSCSQNTLAVRNPANPNIYYMFYQAAQGDPAGFRYVEVDMTLNSGYGDVSSTPGVTLLTPTCEKLSAVRHANGIDVWVVVHQLNSNSFYAYLVTGFGVSAPVISSTGTTINSSFNNVETIGCMKFSCDGMKLAVAHYGDSITELFSFDRTTGIISNPQVLSTSYAPYGVEFSSSSDYLYVSAWSWSGAPIYQYDLTAGNIPASQTQIGTVPASLGAAAGMQIGPDHKIYIAVLFADSLSIIQNPDLPGLSCNFLANGIYLGGNISLYGLPNFITGDYCVPPNPDAVVQTTTPDAVSVYPNPVTENLTIDVGQLNGEVGITVYNSSGQIVLTPEYSGTQYSVIDLSCLPEGIYSIVVLCDDIEYRRQIIHCR